MDKNCWQVAQGRFFAHQYSGKMFRNEEFCAMKSILVYVDGWKTFITNCEEIHNNLSKFELWESCCRELYCGNDISVEASVDSNWLVASV